MVHQSFVFYNNKGGVGKTLLAFNFAVELAMRKPDKKILIIDMDAQCNISSLCLGGGQTGQERVQKEMEKGNNIKTFFMERQKRREKLRPFMLNVYKEREADWEEAHLGDIETQVPKNLYIVCGSVDLDIYSSGEGRVSQPGFKALHALNARTLLSSTERQIDR